jgi:hypothetical protein
MQTSIDFQKQRPPKHKRQGFDSPAEARQYRRQQYGTNSRRQRSRYHDDGLDIEREAKSAAKFMREEERRATEKRAFNLGDEITLQLAQGKTDTATIMEAFTNKDGKWVYHTDSGYARRVMQAELLILNGRDSLAQPVIIAAASIVAERDEVQAFKRGSRRRDLRPSA